MIFPFVDTLFWFGVGGFVLWLAAATFVWLRSREGRKWWNE